MKKSEDEDDFDESILEEFRNSPRNSQESDSEASDFSKKLNMEIPQQEIVEESKDKRFKRVIFSGKKIL